MWKNIVKTGISFSVGFIILYLLFSRQQEAYVADCALKGVPADQCNLWDKIWTDIQGTEISWVLLALLVFMISNIARALRWKQLLQPLGYKPSFILSISAIMVGYLANLGIPRSGEFVRAGMLSKKNNYSFEKVMGTIVTDRIADVLSLGVVLIIAAFFSYDIFLEYFTKNNLLSENKLSQLSSNTTFLIGIVLVVGLAIGGLWFIMRSVHPIAAKLRNIILGFWEGILSILQLKHPILFLLYTVIIWVSYFLMTYIMFKAFAPTEHLGAVQALVVFVFGTLGMLVPSPGGMGSYHFLVGEGLQIFGISPADSFSFANIIFFSLQIGCNVLFGIIALLIVPLLNEEPTITKENTAPSRSS